MALTYQQKQELDRLVRSLTTAHNERERIKELVQAERDAYAIYSRPEFDVSIEGGVWPPAEDQQMDNNDDNRS